MSHGQRAYHFFTRRARRDARLRGDESARQTLLDYLKAGETIDDFLDGFPSVTREQVIGFLDEAEEQIAKMTVPA